MQRALETIDVYGEIIQATTLAQARNLLESHRPDILVADLNLVDGKAYEASEPAVKSGVAGVLHFPGDAALRPDRYLAELARVVRREARGRGR